MAGGVVSDGARGDKRATRFAAKVVQSWTVVQVARWLGVFPSSILRIVNDRVGGVIVNSMLLDACTAVMHAVVVVVLLPSVIEPAGSAKGSTKASTKASTTASTAETLGRSVTGSVASLTACAMYYYNPFNLISALDAGGWRGATMNAAVLLLASVGLRWSRMVHLVPSVALLVDGLLHPPSPTLHPSLSLRWYLNAEVFPSFRRYFSLGISVMGALLSSAVALGCAPVVDTGAGGRGGEMGRRREGQKSNSRRAAGYNIVLAILTIQAMLWELFGTSSSPAVSALWQACVVGLATTPAQVIRTQLLVGLYFVATAMNVAAYQLWIGDNVGNANFFYGMNMVRGAGVCLWVYSLIKDVRRRVCSDGDDERDDEIDDEIDDERDGGDGHQDEGDVGKVKDSVPLASGTSMDDKKTQ